MDAADVKAFFDEVARDWDTMRLTYYDERVIEQLAARTQLTGEQTVADVGTGTGFVAAGLAAHAHRVLGFDNASSMLDVARANVDRLGVHNVELAEGDVADLPLPDHAVDATVANMVLHHATDPAAMLAEMTRVTRPGGWVAITDEIETRTSGCVPSTRTSGSATPAIGSRASSATPGCSTTATPHLAPSETSSPRLRSKSQTSGSSSRGVRCPRAATRTAELTRA
jgi:ubiquinone/menaquinone biosynthesis C-methylase UbiE